MKIVDGYVWIVRNGRQRLLFGKPISSTEWLCENFETNGLTPFENRDEARAGGTREHLRKRFATTSVTLAQVKLKIAEGVADLEILKGEQSLVVIAQGEKETPLLGPLVEGRPGPNLLPGAFLSWNGLRPFRTFGSAMDIAREVRRHGLRATIAAFKLQIIKRL